MSAPPGLPSATLEEHLRKMASLAEGALRTIDRRVGEQGGRPDDGRQKAWFEGYRHAVEEVEYFTAKLAEASGDGAAGTRLPHSP